MPVFEYSSGGATRGYSPYLTQEEVQALELERLGHQGSIIQGIVSSVSDTPEVQATVANTLRVRLETLELDQLQELRALVGSMARVLRPPVAVSMAEVQIETDVSEPVIALPPELDALANVTETETEEQKAPAGEADSDQLPEPITTEISEEVAPEPLSATRSFAFKFHNVAELYRLINKKTKGDYLSDLHTVDPVTLEYEVLGLLGLYVAAHNKPKLVPQQIDRLIGLLESDIDAVAKAHGATVGALLQLKPKAAELIARQLDSLLATSPVPAESQTPTEEGKEEVPAPASLPVPDAPKGITQEDLDKFKDEPPHVRLTEELALILDLDGGQKSALRGMLDPKMRGELTAAKENVAGLLRTKIHEDHGKIVSILGLTPGEAASLRMFLGVQYEGPEQRILIKDPIQAGDMILRSQRSGQDPKRTRELLYGALGKLSKAYVGDVPEEVDAAAIRAVVHAHDSLSLEQIQAAIPPIVKWFSEQAGLEQMQQQGLRERIDRSVTGSPDGAAKSALATIERLIIANAKDIGTDPRMGKPLMALRLFVNSTFGEPETIQSISSKLQNKGINDQVELLILRALERLGSYIEQKGVAA